MITLAAVLIFIVLGALAVFQALLVLGAPLGQFAWGGQHRVLPTPLRIGSVVSILIYALISAIVLARVGALTFGVSTNVARIAIWVVAAYFFLGIGMNLASKSKSERAVMPAVCAVLCVLSVVVALN